MPEFLDLLPPDVALKRYLEHITPLSGYDEVETKSGLDRVIKADVLAPHPLPSFPRSTVDGYAVHAADTYGASESLPGYLKLVGEVKMGAGPDFKISAGQCGLIHTGGMLPDGADAVIMLEHTQVANPSEIEMMHSVAVGENVIKIGEDVSAGQVVIPAGSLLRSAEIGGLLALGITKINVVKRPVIGIISTGDEVVPPQMDINPGQVRDINSYTLSTLIEKSGASALPYGIFSDDEENLLKIASQAIQECNMVVITAGSSASARDLTAQVINKLGRPGVLVHGVNVRPGKPTILAVIRTAEDERTIPIVGLPGNPVSALVIATLFIEPVIDALRGLNSPRIRPRIQANLTINLASKAGREDWVPVKLNPIGDQFAAEPIFGKSNLIFTLARADGLLHIPSDATGLNPGDHVDVLLL
jgi:molybdopterin molybdotransferase